MNLTRPARLLATAATLAALTLAPVSGASGAALPRGATSSVAAAPAVIDPADYVCTTSLREKYFESQASGIDMDVLVELDELGALSLPSMYAETYLDTRARGFGASGQYTREVRHTLRDLRRFWDVRPESVRVVPMKGRAVFDDIDGLTPVIAEGFHLSTTDARARALRIRELLAEVPALRHGDNGLFANGVYTRIPGFMGWTGPYTIFLGDGVLQEVVDQDLPIGIKQILAHEYAHVVQDLVGRTIPLDRSPEVNRASELLSDAMGAYYVAHRRGGKVAHQGAAAVADLITVGGLNGDCDFAWNNHHGTVAQREKAAAFGVRLASPTRHRGTVLGVRAFISAFDAELPTLVAPDAR